MYKRELYLKKIQKFIEKPVVKVITGMRRVGKSYFLRMIIDHLHDNGVGDSQIIYVDMESLDFEFIGDHRELNQFVQQTTKERGNEKKAKYLFVDEIQKIENWEKCIASLLGSGSYDIFISGSNAQMLSSELASLLSGRYIEFPVYSLSFYEFMDFIGKEKKTALQLFSQYLEQGGFPALTHFDNDREVSYQYISSLYNTILLKDVVKRYRLRNITLLEGITRYAFDNIGNIFSAKKISDFLKSQKLSVGVETVQNYLAYICSTYALHKVQRFDIKGKRILELHEKYFLGDIGLRHALLGYREGDIGGILENIVFLELKRRGYTVFIGKLGTKEVDFIATRAEEKVYIQVAYLLASEETVEREFSPLLEIKDNYPKYVLSMDTAFGSDYEGVKRLHITDFLLRCRCSEETFENG